MKGLSAKKIAAIVAGAALVGTALAPFVSALDLKKADVYDGQGAPAVSVVVGSNAAISDVVWAGNIAAAVARNATTTATATGTPIPSVCGGAGATWNPPTALSVDLSVGGTTTLGAGSKQIKINMNSASGGTEIDKNTLTSSTLTHLINTTQTETVNSSQSTITAQETIGVTIDARFDPTSTVRDLIATVSSGDFNYDVSLGTGIPLNGATNKNYSYFTDSGVVDNVKVPFFGEWYTLTTADLNSTTKNLTLNLISAVTTLNPGDTVTGLVGDGKFAGMPMSVKFVSLGTQGSTDVGTFELYDGNGTLVDTQTLAGTGANLRQVFVGGGTSQGYSLATDLYVNTITKTSGSGSAAITGHVEVTKGTGTVLLYDGKGYPYNPNETTGVYDYTVTINSSVLNTSAAVLKGYTIKNSREKWDASGVGNGPINPSGGFGLQGKAAVTASFGNALPAGTAGKNYAKISFEGFDDTAQRTQVVIGKNPVPSTSSVPFDARANFGGVYFPGADDTLHGIPFALKLSNTGAASWDSFVFDGQTIFYQVDLEAADANVRLPAAATTQYLNGHAVTVTDVNGAVLTIDGIVTPGGGTDTNAGFGTGASFTLDGVRYTITDGNADNAVTIRSEGYATFRQASSTGTIIASRGSLDTNTTSPLYGKWFFSRYVVNHNASMIEANVRLLGNNSKPFRYAQYSNGNTYWLVLDANQTAAGIGSEDSTTIQKSHSIKFLGTATTNLMQVAAGTTEKAGPDQNFYLPDSSDWNGSSYASGDTGYQVAVFQVNDASSGVVTDFNVFINTEDGGLFTLPNSNLTYWASNADYLGTPIWSLTNGSQSNFLSAGWTDTGGKATLDVTKGNMTFSFPQTLEQVKVNVLGKSVTVQTQGGEDLSVKEGETETTSGGTKITVSKVNYTPGLPSAGGAGDTVVVTPVTYTKAVGGYGNLVYLDKDSVSGSLIVVGGPAVNKMAKGVPAMEALKSAGEKVVEVATNGNVYVAGYTAEDTISAAADLIAALDSLE